MLGQNSTNGSMSLDSTTVFFLCVLSQSFATQLGASLEIIIVLLPPRSAGMTCECHAYTAWYLLLKGDQGPPCWATEVRGIVGTPVGKQQSWSQVMGLRTAALEERGSVNCGILLAVGSTEERRPSRVWNTESLGQHRTLDFASQPLRKNSSQGWVLLRI